MAKDDLLRRDLDLILGGVGAKSGLAGGEPSFATLLSDPTRRVRRAQLATASVATLVAVLGVSPTEITALGMKLPASTPWLFQLSLLLVHAYFTSEFVYFARNDFHEWVDSSVRGAIEAIRVPSHGAPRDQVEKAERVAREKMESSVRSALRGSRVVRRLNVEILLPFYFALFSGLGLALRTVVSFIEFARAVGS